MKIKQLVLRYKKLEYLILTAILLLASFMRLYKISEYMTFLGDEGRDVLVVREILHGNFTLLGPRASAADFFSGPIYYYFMAPFLWIFGYDPVGPAVMIALLGIATVFLVYYIGKEFFGQKAGFIAATLYSVSPLVIAFSRSSWNPNSVPFFSLLILFILYKAVQDSSWKKFVISGVLLGITMQLHYQAIWLTAIIVFFILAGSIFLNKKLKIIPLIKHYLQLFSGFLLGFSPFLLFEIRHGFPNTNTILNFIFKENTQRQYESGISFLDVVWNVFFRLFGRLLTRFPPPEQIPQGSQPLWVLLTIIFALVSIYALIKLKPGIISILLSIWLFVGVFIFGFYKKPIYDYYFAFMFPLPFLLAGNLLASVYSYSRLKVFGKIMAIAILGYLFYFNLLGMPFLHLPNRQKDQVKSISDFILAKTDGKPFNFALITHGNSDHSYRYFFETAGRRPVTIENEMNDPGRKTVTDQLLIVCEDQSCKPLGNPLWEVSGFGRGEIAGEWKISVVKVYKLVHYKGQ